MAKTLNTFTKITFHYKDNQKKDKSKEIIYPGQLLEFVKNDPIRVINADRRQPVPAGLYFITEGRGHTMNITCGEDDALQRDYDAHWVFE